MVWYRLDEPGTYSVAVVKSKDVEFAIYQSIDLSLPLGQYKDQTTERTLSRSAVDHPEKLIVDHPEKFTAKKYVMVDPPYYIRVYHPDRTATSDYILFVHKHGGESPENAIELIPHKSNPEVKWEIIDGVKTSVLPTFFPTSPPGPINPDDTVWFEFNTLAVADWGPDWPRVPQDIVCEMSGYDKDKPVFQMTLREADLTLTPDVRTDPPDPSKVTLRLNDLGPKKRYLCVTRKDDKFSAKTFAVVWKTNLTVFHGTMLDIPSAGKLPGTSSIGNPYELKIVCDNLTDPENGPDQILVRVWVDGNKRIEGLTNKEKFWLHSEGTLQALIPNGLRYLEKVSIQLSELDSVSGDDESKAIPFPPLDIHRENPKDKPYVFDFSGGLYILYYNRSSQLTSAK